MDHRTIKTSIIEIFIIAPLLLLNEMTIEHFVPRNNNQRNVHDTIKKPGPREINKMIQALTIEERNEMFDLAEKDDVEKGPAEQDFI